MPGKGKPFAPGDPRAGRPKGAPNKTSRDARLLAQSLVSDPEYVQKLKARLLEGKAAHMEALLWHYAYGAPPSKPVDAMTLMCEDILETDGADV
jgi:hypothetical protein